MASSADPPDDDVVRFLLSQDDLLDALLTEHVDRHGWCPACPGPQSGRHRYPCDVRLIAERARRARDARASLPQPDDGRRADR